MGGLCGKITEEPSDTGSYPQRPIQATMSAGIRPPSGERLGTQPT